MNEHPDRERAVSLIDVEVPLASEALTELLTGREAYRHTQFLVARRGERVGLVEVATRSREPLFSPIVDVRLVARPEECALVVAPEVDVGVPTQLAEIARTRAPEARCVVVIGRYEHLGFLLESRPLRVRVIDVAPPHPPKLIDQLHRVLAVAEDLPPVQLDEELIDVVALADAQPAPEDPTVLFPCRASGLALEGRATLFLDQRPTRAPWLLVGCARSREIHRWFYGDEPPTRELCPRHHVPDDGAVTLVRCCLVEEGVERDGATVMVPWGATLEEVRRGLDVVLADVEPG